MSTKFSQSVSEAMLEVGLERLSLAGRPKTPRKVSFHDKVSLATMPLIGPGDDPVSGKISKRKQNIKGGPMTRERIAREMERYLANGGVVSTLPSEVIPIFRDVHPHHGHYDDTGVGR